MADGTTTIADLKQAVREFVNERDWSQFHSPKNLSMSIAIESAELMEHFQWLDAHTSHDIRQDKETMVEVQEEVADVLCYLLSFANALEIDLDAALRDKLVKNARKYPAEKFRGRFR